MIIMNDDNNNNIDSNNIKNKLFISEIIFFAIIISTFLILFFIVKNTLVLRDIPHSTYHRETKCKIMSAECSYTLEFDGESYTYTKGKSLLYPKEINLYYIDNQLQEKNIVIDKLVKLLESDNSNMFFVIIGITMGIGVIIGFYVKIKIKKSYLQ